jgi:NAD(P)H-hydrate epimerase
MLPPEAAYCGVFVHGLAGDLAAAKIGQRSIMALDILDYIDDALKVIELR